MVTCEKCGMSRRRCLELHHLGVPMQSNKLRVRPFKFNCDNFGIRTITKDIYNLNLDKYYGVRYDRNIIK